jgi:hypothetical protein
VWQPHCFRNGGGGDGGHIVDSNHRIDRVMPGECNRDWSGSLRISNIERQDIVR